MVLKCFPSVFPGRLLKPSLCLSMWYKGIIVIPIHIRIIEGTVWAAFSRVSAHSTCLKIIATIIGENGHCWFETFLNPSGRISSPLSSGSSVPASFIEHELDEKKLTAPKPVSLSYSTAFLKAGFFLKSLVTGTEKVPSNWRMKARRNIT